VTCASSQLLVAGDVSRLLGLAFPVILYGAEELRSSLDEKRFAIVLWQVVLVSFLIPHYYVGQGAVSAMASRPEQWLHSLHNPRYVHPPVATVTLRPTIVFENEAKVRRTSVVKVGLIFDCNGSQRCTCDC
jgi:hypothetical protein